MTKLAIAFTNFGPYHLARLRALGGRLQEEGGELIAHEVAGREGRYPWQVSRSDEPFSWTTLVADRPLEEIAGSICKQAMTEALDRDQPDAVAVCGYSRPESMAALRWAVRNRRPAILMSETQKIDHPRTWWKEAIKRSRVQKFAAAIVGGPRHRDYLIELGMPADRIALGYNAVDNASFASLAENARKSSEGRKNLPARDYFLTVNRFVPEKNLTALIRAFAAYRSQVPEGQAWDLVLSGDGTCRAEIEATIASVRLEHAIHLAGFLQASELSRLYAFASGFVHPSRMEPWGLVVNEAAACGLPLLVSDRAGCVETLVPEPTGTTGRRFDPGDATSMTAAMTWLASLAREDRDLMGRRAARVVSHWGPDRFASGMIEALAKAGSASLRKRASELVPIGGAR